MNLRNLALIPVLSLIISIFATLFLDLSEKLAFNPPYLLLTLNLIFWATATLAIAFISAKSFLKEDSSIVLIISCSIIIFALPVIISGWVQTFSVNDSIALSNPCILVASILQVIGSILAFQGKQETKTSNRKRLLATAYLASVILVLANLTVALLGYYPPFFVASGPTLLRQVVLGSAVFFFVVAAIVFGLQYLRSKSPSLYWYALAIGLFSIGLFSAFEQKAIGDLPTWLGRATLYTGTIYLIVALRASRKSTIGTDVAGGWAEAFRSDRKQAADFFSRMLNSFAYFKIVISKEGKPIDYIFLDINNAFEKLTGLNKNDVLGKKASEIMNSDALEDWLSILGPVVLTGEAVTLDHFSRFSKKWVHMTIYSPQKNYLVSISEDITERKKAEESLQSSEKQKNDILESITDGFVAFDKEWRYTYVNSNAARILHTPKEGLIGKVAIDVFPDAAKFLIEFKKAVASGRPVHFEGYYPEPLNVWYECHCYPSQAGLTVFFSDITQRKKAEEALKESEKRYRGLFEAVGGGVVVQDPTGAIVEANEAACEILGLTWDQMQGRTSYDPQWHSIHEDNSPFPGDQHPAMVTLKTGRAIQNVIMGVFHPSTGQYRWIIINSEPIIDEKSKTVSAAVTTFVDITERKKAEEGLQQQKALVQQERDRLSSLLNSITDEVWFADTEKKFTLANSSAVKEFKLDSSTQSADVESLAENLEVLRPDGSPRPAEEAPPLRALKGEIVKNQEEIVRTPSNGELRYRQVSAAPVKDADGKIIGSVSVVRDINESKKAEEALVEREQLYRTVFDNSQDGFQLIELVYDEHGKPIDHKFLRVNSAYERIIGVKAEDIFDKTAKYISPNQEPHWLEVPDRVAKTGISEHVELYNKDINKTLDCYYFLYSKNVVGTLFRDITERKRLEKQLQDQERLAAVGATAGMVGHDIRNPLQAITSDLFLAKSDLSELPENENKTNALESLDEIQNNIDYINKIVADLQDFARPLNPRAQETNIKSLFHDILAKNGIPKNIKVTVKVEAKAEKIMADPDYLKRIATNLTLNAIQAMPNGGKLTIRAYVEEQTNDVLITVKDTGVGIPEDIKPKLFTPMMTTKSKGQGFGLAVVKRMTEGLGGTVAFESTEGKGTTFIVRLPPPKELNGKWTYK